MPHTKRRTFQHIMEDQSLAVLQAHLPEEWVIREYKPDYGIDLAIELFAYRDAQRTKADTLGEIFFAQVKSVQTLDVTQMTVYARFNVEKEPLRENRAAPLEIRVIKFVIDTNELLTVQAMGAGLQSFCS